ncbi:adenylate kinase [Candidatus Uhrbacteria bacterium CG10_big_fil_rev_8_21_14_0_10_48_16]|uniref:Adenylate kinase n=1 Tax=Candidatus Uhrbacteria bacterium CG10_big_fil_rev_8_21_14_0_10_48_16 TaxID=1975038 RepID=A0A2M8LGQ6_9BACT|nr:MAG: adenylate kinase [Candidatus Uhrbacteria bacterium CG10_big_fil_rev_8_21_14_0_10_48_16]
MSYKILLMGPQGSGKGTQAEKLSERLGIPAFGMGQLLRDEIASGSDLGLKFSGILKAGELVSDEDAAEMLKRRLAKSDTQNGYILDGYPRNMSQYEAFNFDIPTHVLVIDVPRAESLKRLGGRLTCRGCGKVASIHDGLKVGDLCPCGSAWYQREDDTPEAITRRLEIYEHDTMPVVENYGKLVAHVDGLGSIEEVFARLLTALE